MPGGFEAMRPTKQIPSKGFRRKRAICLGRLQSSSSSSSPDTIIAQVSCHDIFHLKRLSFLKENFDKTLQRTWQFYSESSQEKEFCIHKSGLLFELNYPNDRKHFCENTSIPAPHPVHPTPDSKETTHHHVFYVTKHQTRYFNILVWTTWNRHFSYFSLYALFFWAVVFLVFVGF